MNSLRSVINRECNEEMISKLLNSVLITAILFISGSVSSHEPLTELRSVPNLHAGYVRDGTIVMTGKIINRENAAGFYLRCGAQQSAGISNKCILYGINNQHHKLNVRLEGRGWQAAPSGKMGIVNYNSSAGLIFRVVSDGDQLITADKWRVDLVSAAIH